MTREELIEVMEIAFVKNDNPQNLTAGITATLVALENAQWQPIETAPKDPPVRILLWSPAGKPKQIEIGHWHQPGNPKLSGFWTARKHPTRWMPIPEPPK